MKNLIDVYVKSVVVVKTGEDENSILVLLAEKEGNRILPIGIGIFEAQAIARALEGIKFQRPLTHDLIANILNELNVKLEKVIINDLVDGTFYARLILKEGNRTLSVDARPSDSIAVALLMNAPIYVSAKVMDEAGEIPPEDGGFGESFEA